MKTTKIISDDHLLDLAAVCGWFGVSESTIRRRMRERREGISTFPLPLFKSHCRLVWRKSDIVNWSGEDGEVFHAPLSPIPSFPKVSTAQSNDQARKELLGLGVRLPSFIEAAAQHPLAGLLQDSKPSKEG